MSDILVLLDHTADGALRASVRELVTLARDLAGASSGTVRGVWAVDGAEPSAQAVAELGALGVTHVHRLTSDADLRVAAVLAEGLGALLTELGDPAGGGVSVLLGVSSFEVKEVAAHLAVATGAGVVTDADALERVDGALVAGKTVFAGTWTTRTAVRAALAVVLLKPNSVVASDAPSAVEPQVSELVVAAGPAASRVRVVERTERPATGRPDLGSAHVVVVGGRGTEGDFTPLEELADVLGGAVGATRVATDEGWIGHDAQIGQTGVTISPRLYIGAGVSGAVHHRGGMQASGTIVAINSDADAPIFEIADYGIVGDLTAVVPQLTQELRRLKG